MEDIHNHCFVWVWVMLTGIEVDMPAGHPTALSASKPPASSPPASSPPAHPAASGSLPVKDSEGKKKKPEKKGKLPKWFANKKNGIFLNKLIEELHNIRFGPLVPMSSRTIK